MLKLKKSQYLNSILTFLKFRHLLHRLKMFQVDDRPGNLSKLAFKKKKKDRKNRAFFLN